MDRGWCAVRRVMRPVADRFSLTGAAKHCTTVLAIPATIVLGLVLSSAPAFAQTQGRVIRDGTIIWRFEASVPATIAKAGTILDVTARSNRWYEVIIPEAVGGHGERGLIALSQIELVSGSPEPPFRALRGSGPAMPRGQR